MRKRVCIRRQAMVAEPLRQVVRSRVLSDLGHQLIAFIVGGHHSVLVNFAESVSGRNVADSDRALAAKDVHVGVRHLKALGWYVHWRSLKCRRRVSLDAARKFCLFQYRL